MRRAFTLIELLVVIGIIALLMGILLPGLALARRHARSVAGNANMRSLTQIMLMYTGDNGDAFLDPFHKGCDTECDRTSIDCTDAPLTENPPHGWDFGVDDAPVFSTEYFAYYWYSYLLVHDDAPAFAEEQTAPSDTHIRGLADRYGDSQLFSGRDALWPSSFLYSPTFWCSVNRYDPSDTRGCNAFNQNGKTQRHASVTFPSSKVLLFERMDFEQKERVRIGTSDSFREGRSPAWNNLGATTAVSVVDGSVEEIALRDLYTAAAEPESDVRPVGVCAMIDGPPIVLKKGSGQEAVGGESRADGEYPLFFWATRWGVEGRDLAR